MSDVTKDKSIKLTVKVLVPVRDHPKFNFVGKLLGPKGNSLKRLQEETMTKMAILGRGSMRDKQKEEELRLSGDQKFNHLSEDLHVEVAAVAPPAEAHARIAYALTEIRRYLVPDYNDEIRQEQMREMQIINNATTTSAPHSSEQPSVNNCTAAGCSEEESCSPQSNGGETNHQAPSLKDGVGINGRRGPPPPPPKSSNSATVSLPPSQHPAFRGLNRSQTSLLSSSGKDGSASKSRGTSQGRRSVLSLLTKARAIQQKEHEFMGVFHDMASYSVYDHMGDLPIGEPASDDLAGRSVGSLKVTTSPNERSRFRHDPYPRIASST